jgi:hypothetical protein
MGTARSKPALSLLAGVVVLGVMAVAWTIGSRLSDAQPGTMHDCPLAGKAAISVWTGGDHADASQALTSCGVDGVAAAYALDPQSQKWTRWFAGRPDISDLQALDGLQGVLALAGAAAPTTATPIAGATGTPTPPATAQGGMQHCPPAQKWAISVWDGESGTGSSEALATCTASPVVAAYALDLQSQKWLRWFAGRPDISDLETLDNLQGVLALSGTAAPVTPTPSATATPTPATTPGTWSHVCYVGDTSAAATGVDSIADSLQVAYRLRPDQNFDRYIPTNPDVNTLTTLEPFDTLLMLRTSSETWEQDVTDTAPSVVSLTSGWNWVCHTGPEGGIEEATEDWGDFTSLYRLDAVSGTWCRYFADMPELSNCVALEPYQAVFVLAPGGLEGTCAPVIPGTYSGTATIDGSPAPDGTMITAVLFGTEWGSAVTSGGRYVMDIPSPLPSTEPCFSGGDIQFQGGGLTAGQSPSWNAGFHEVDLTFTSP